MDSFEQSRKESDVAERLTARFARLWTEYRRLAEEREAIESSTAWAMAQRLARWRRLIAPEGSRRQACLRLLLAGLRLRRRPRIRVQTQQIGEEQRNPTEAPQVCVAAGADRQEDRFRVVYVGSRWAFDAATMRYRAHNYIEALALAGLEATFVSQDEVHTQLSAILSCDLIVLVRRILDDTTTTLIGLARRRGVPIVYDIDDYIFDPWVMPYVEALQDPLGRAKALRLMEELGACLDQCLYFTGSTAYLAEKAGALGKKSFVIHNSLNAAQLSLSQAAREERGLHRIGRVTRIGYFSGTRTHQADLRIVYPALMQLLREESDIRLVLVGQLDVGAFPGLAPYKEQIDILPICHWHKLPEVIAGVDINVIPLELTPFNEGKSNLKYFEAGLVEVPSVASPTRILCESITHGHNGLLARTTEEWYSSLKELAARPEWRRQLGKNAFDHVMQNYTPAASAAAAVKVYREILRLNRIRLEGPKDRLSVVVLVADLRGQWEQVLRRVNILAAAGHVVTVQVALGKNAASATAIEKAIQQTFPKPLFTVQRAEIVPRCDVLIAADPRSRSRVIANQHSARFTIADEALLSMFLASARGLEPVLRDWLRNGPPLPPPKLVA